MSVAIVADGLSKRYQLGTRQAYGSLRDTIANLVRMPFVGLARGVDADVRRADTIWALRDVSFDIRQGDIVGILGRNGSGKSTLLKVLSRITEPTSGRAEVHGRVGSLLEVGTGFHPELTGRENVFVNGAILGMRRAEIARKFDEIVDFADVERFIDTPVKFYSSGMQMRLAFAVAAHLEPDIILVDEVLAVGDGAFQAKCLGKMHEVSHAGRTVLFVSHQMNQIRRLCGRCIWLDQGRVVAIGETADVMGKYEASLVGTQRSVESVTDAHVPARFLGWDLRPAGSTDQGLINHVLTTDGPIVVRFWLRLNQPLKNGHHGIALSNSEGMLVWGTGTDELVLEPGVHAIEYAFESLPIKPGAYQWLVTLFEDQVTLDTHVCVPELIVSTIPTGHRRDECAGVLNLRYSIDFAPGAESSRVEPISAAAARRAR
jgi:ABC-type polysaccharide/polyol phosphate transport system ATPase subunit